MKKGQIVKVKIKCFRENRIEGILESGVMILFLFKKGKEEKFVREHLGQTVELDWTEINAIKGSFHNEKGGRSISKRRGRRWI